MSGWFAELCERNGLVAQDRAKRADELTTDDVLFTATGEPRYPTKVRVRSRNTYVDYADGWSDAFRNSQQLSLLAARSAVTS